ncbi:MAG: hypothetical protein HQL86_08550 [Magnetococcales bacterium]|nr:hypothetical protein [Magnetococcales bacterium]
MDGSFEDGMENVEESQGQTDGVRGPMAPGGIQGKSPWDFDFFNFLYAFALRALYIISFLSRLLRKNAQRALIYVP